MMDVDPMDLKYWEIALGPLFPVEIGRDDSPRVGFQGRIARSLRVCDDGTLLAGVGLGFYGARDRQTIGLGFPHLEYRVGRPNDRVSFSVGAGALIGRNPKGDNATDFGWTLALGLKLSNRTGLEIRTIRGPKEGMSSWTVSYVWRF